MANTQVELHITGLGVITLELDAEKAPLTTANFLAYVNKGHYNNTVFHRVILDVARLLPDIAPDEPLPPLDAETTRVRLFEGLARTIEQHAPLLAVDDLQWADTTTLEWLVLLAHRGRTRWIATARDGAELAAPVEAALASLQAAGVARLVELQGLDRAALNTLLHERRPDLAAGQAFPRPHPWLAVLAVYTGGNAFCAIEVMDALQTGDTPRQLARMPLPQRVTAMLLHRPFVEAFNRSATASTRIHMWNSCPSHFSDDSMPRSLFYC